MEGSSSSQSPSDGGNGKPPVFETKDSAASMQKLKDVKKSIEKTLALINQLTLQFETSDGALQMELFERINGLVQELDNMVQLSQNCNIEVPMEVINLIDDGKNPNLYTKDVINNCIAKNQITKGKTDAFKDLRNHLFEELEQNFPDVVETFRESRAAAASADAAGTSIIQGTSIDMVMQEYSALGLEEDESLEVPGPNIRPALGPEGEGSLDPMIRPAMGPEGEGTLDPIIRPALGPEGEVSLDPIIRPALGPEGEVSLDPIIRPALSPVEEGSLDPITRSERKKRKPKYLEDYEN